MRTDKEELKRLAGEFIKAVHCFGVVNALEGGVIDLDSLLADFVGYLKNDRITAAKIYMKDEFKLLLSNKIVVFSYRKVDGTIRDAIGTLRPELLPARFTTEQSQMMFDVLEGIIEHRLQDTERVQKLVDAARPKQGQGKTQPEEQLYWDLVAAGWRKLKFDQLISVNDTF